MTGTRIKGCAKHFAQIMNTWEGVSMTHRVFTETNNEIGELIGTSYTDNTVTGVISSLPKESSLRDAGWVDAKNLVGFFTDTSISEHDHIIFDGNTFEVVKIHGVLYDISTEVAITVELSNVM